MTQGAKIDHYAGLDLLRFAAACLVVSRLDRGWIVGLLVVCSIEIWIDRPGLGANLVSLGLWWGVARRAAAQRRAPRGGRNHPVAAMSPRPLRRDLRR